MHPLALGGRRVTMRSSTLPVGTDRSVQCPVRGEINVSTCAECPLLIKLANRRGKVTVLCCLPREKRTRPSSTHRTAGWPLGPAREVVELRLCSAGASQTQRRSGCGGTHGCRGSVPRVAPPATLPATSERGTSCEEWPYPFARPVGRGPGQEVSDDDTRRSKTSRHPGGSAWCFHRRHRAAAAPPSAGWSGVSAVL